MENVNARVLFVCMGNICRSPAGEGILKNLLREDPELNIIVESCGIGDWHVGRPPDSRIQEVSKMRGIILTSRAQQFQHDFFKRFDYILAADKEVLQYLHRYANDLEDKAKISLITEFSCAYHGQEVPDPYYQGDEAFEFVLDMLEDACIGLITHIRQKSSS